MKSREGVRAGGVRPEGRETIASLGRGTMAELNVPNDQNVISRKGATAQRAPSEINGRTDIDLEQHRIFNHRRFFENNPAFLCRLGDLSEAGESLKKGSHAKPQRREGLLRR